MKTAIATVLHDPNLIVHRKLLEMRLEHTFKNDFFVVVSKDTPVFAYTTAIPEATIYVQSGRGIADARRCCLKWFLNVPAFADCDRIMLLDFDRLLFWLAHDKASLLSILDSSWSPYIIVGRTEAAMQSHPEVQRNTERAINAYMFHNLFPDEAAWDVLAGTYLMNRPMAELTLAKSFALQPGAVDVEWYAIARSNLEPDKLMHVKVDGLGYEGAWLGLEPSNIEYEYSESYTGLKIGATADILRKRYDNLDQAKAMVDIIKTWRDQ